MIRSTALYRKRNDVAGALIGFFLGFCLNIAQHYRRIVAGIAFNAAEQYFPCLVHRQSGNSLQLLELLIVKFLDGSLGVLSFFYLLVELLLALLYTIDFFIQCFLALEQPALVALQLVASLSQFLFIFVLNAVGFFLGFKNRFLLYGLSPLLGVADHFFNCFFCVSYLCFRYIAPVNISTCETRS